MSDAASQQFAVVLTNEKVFTSPPMDMGSGSESYPLRDPVKDGEIEQQLEKAIFEVGGTRKWETHSETQIPSFGSGNRHHFPEDVHITTETITYACGSVAALAVFIRNVVGALKDWRDLKAARYVEVKVGDKTIKLKDGDDLAEAIQKFAKEMDK